MSNDSNQWNGSAVPLSHLAMLLDVHLYPKISLVDSYIRVRSGVFDKEAVCYATGITQEEYERLEID